MNETAWAIVLVAVVNTVGSVMHSWIRAKYGSIDGNGPLVRPGSGERVADILPTAPPAQPPSRL